MLKQYYINQSLLGPQGEAGLNGVNGAQGAAGVPGADYEQEACSGEQVIPVQS